MPDNREHTEAEEGYGMALGFRIFEADGEMILTEAEITPYVDDPNAVGATLVFHPLAGVDPTVPDDDDDTPFWHIDIDDELTREESAPITEQFQSIVRQLSSLGDNDLREYLKAAREQEGLEEEDEEEAG